MSPYADPAVLHADPAAPGGEAEEAGGTFVFREAGGAFVFREAGGTFVFREAGGT